MKKLILLLSMLIIAPVQSAQVVNVEYIHTAIADKWDITIPYNREITNVGVAANMKYLLTAIDVANEILNGEKTTDYGNGEFATMVVADTVATDTAVETLIQKNETKEYKFFITTTPDTSSFDFSISAAGEFYIDWGDGKTETITRTNTTNTSYTHTYDTAGTYVISFGGKATGYNRMMCNWITCSSMSISFKDNSNIATVAGSLGEIFGILSDGAMANFSHTFYGCENMTNVFDNLFLDKDGLVTSDRFYSSFAKCRSLTSIPENLFGTNPDIFNDQDFEATFWRCAALTGPSAKINGKYLYEIWPTALFSIYGPYCDANNLSDYSLMPSAWKYCD